MKLKFATLFYGATSYAVKPNEITPIPEVFDFDNAVDCAKHIFAVMSNASGGHRLTGCTLRIHKGRRQANLSAMGVHVYYCDDAVPKIAGLEEFVVVESETETFVLGDVVTDQYGRGYERAKWEAN